PSCGDPLPSGGCNPLSSLTSDGNASAQFGISWVIGVVLKALLQSAVDTAGGTSLPADRQRIVEILPTTHRGAFVAQERQSIVEVGGGADSALPRSLPF